MAKSGRYSADRKKVELIESAKTVEVAECGTIFTLSGGADNFDITLPTLAEAGNGWWCKFVLLANKTSNYQKVQTAVADRDKMIASVFGGLDQADATGAVAFDAEADSVVFNGSQGKAGDTIEVICLGNKWHAQGFSAAAAAGMEITT